ncbi:fibrous sheath-interacting protein 1 isoform X2 [Mixophyes fleayi]|uniref:fibrous sheath-interacting protein 1 isoform X2 n=1 Tax=Mixophyes fleayi TaxID=3061075 RepID=UPI003F4DE8A3
MDIVKGNLDDISRLATVSRSHPGSRISSSFHTDRPKINSTVGSLEVLTPESSISQWDLIMDLDDELDSEDSHGENFTDFSLEWDKETIKENLKLTHPLEESETDEEFQHELYEIPATENNERAQNVREDCREDSTDLPQSTEEWIDPKLHKAIKRMKALDELLCKKIEREKEVKAQSLEIRKQLWEELQLVTQSSARSHEEVVNTITFLALTPQLNDVKDTTVFEKTFPVFSTQPPPEDYDADPEALQDNVSGIENSDLLNNSEILRQGTKQKKNKSNKKGVNFIQRNIELAKDAGSHVLLMDDEKLRLEQLLGDIQDDCSDDDATADFSLCLVPGEGYTPEPGKLKELAKIEAELQMFSSTKVSILTNHYDPGILAKESKQEVLMNKFGNPEAAPGEKALRYTRELREQRIRLKEIDQQLEDIERNSTTPSSMSHYSSLFSESSVTISLY